MAGPLRPVGAPPSGLICVQFLPSHPQVSEKFLVTLDDRLNSADKRLGKLEDCCLELHKEFAKVTSDISHIPTVVDNMLLKHKVQLLEKRKND